jgi:mannose-6-phosphate isomerase-like protein (cupin superfamily)
MRGHVQDIDSIIVRNDDFRRVLYTASSCQLVVMALKPKEESGLEPHKPDQFFLVEGAEAVLDDVRTMISAGFAVLVPSGLSQ